jgi:hypothetical protein
LTASLAQAAVNSFSTQPEMSDRRKQLQHLPRYLCVALGAATRRCQHNPHACLGQAAAFIHWPVTRARWRSRDTITATPSLLMVGIQIWPSKHSASMTWRGAEMRLLDCENGGCDLLKSLTFWMGCVAGPLEGSQCHLLTRQRPFAGDTAHCERASHIEPSNIFAGVPCAAPGVCIARI